MRHCNNLTTLSMTQRRRGMISTTGEPRLPSPVLDREQKVHESYFIKLAPVGIVKVGSTGSITPRTAFATTPTYLMKAHQWLKTSIIYKEACTSANTETKASQLPTDLYIYLQAAWAWCHVSQWCQCRRSDGLGCKIFLYGSLQQNSYAFLRVYSGKGKARESLNCIYQMSINTFYLLLFMFTLFY